jgi:hypothetical protein
MIRHSSHLPGQGISLARSGSSQSRTRLTPSHAACLADRTVRGARLELRVGFPDAWQLAARFESGAERSVSLAHAHEKQPMATKLNIMTCLQQAQGLTEVAYRCAQPRSLGQLTLRAPASQTAARRGLRVSIDIQSPQDAPYPVRIVHVREPSSVPTLSV